MPSVSSQEHWGEDSDVGKEINDNREEEKHTHSEYDLEEEGSIIR